MGFGDDGFAVNRYRKIGSEAYGLKHALIVRHFYTIYQAECLPADDIRVIPDVFTNANS